MNPEQLQSLAVLAIGNGASGSALVGLDSDAGLNAAAVPNSPLRHDPRHQQLVAVLPLE
jgi:hypothetical protein